MCRKASGDITIGDGCERTQLRKSHIAGDVVIGLMLLSITAIMIAIDPGITAKGQATIYGGVIAAIGIVSFIGAAGTFASAVEKAIAYTSETDEGPDGLVNGGGDE
jgi:hypothetical protein